MLLITKACKPKNDIKDKISLFTKGKNRNVELCKYMLNFKPLCSEFYDQINYEIIAYVEKYYAMFIFKEQS